MIREKAGSQAFVGVYDVALCLFSIKIDDWLFTKH